MHLKEYDKIEDKANKHCFIYILTKNIKAEWI